MSVWSSAMADGGAPPSAAERRRAPPSAAEVAGLERVQEMKDSWLKDL